MSYEKQLAEARELLAQAANAGAEPAAEPPAEVDEGTTQRQAENRARADALEADREAARQAKERHANLVSPAQGSTARTPDNQAEAQLSRDDLKGMSPAQIVAAMEAGRLDEVQGK